MKPNEEYDESIDKKPHSDGTLLAIYWPKHGLAKVKKCPLANSLAAPTMQVCCLSCRQCRGFFSPGRPISNLPIEINGHNRILFQQVICEHPAVRRRDSDDSDTRVGKKEE